MKTPKKQEKKKVIAKYLLVYYTSPDSGGHRELIYLPDGEITTYHDLHIEKLSFKFYKENVTLDSRYPYITTFSAELNPVSEDRRIWNYLTKLSPKPY